MAINIGGGINIGTGIAIGEAPPVVLIGVSPTAIALPYQATFELPNPLGPGLPIPSTRNGQWLGTGTFADGVSLYAYMFQTNYIAFYTDAALLNQYTLPLDLPGSPGQFFAL